MLAVEAWAAAKVPQGLVHRPALKQSAFGESFLRLKMAPACRRFEGDALVGSFTRSVVGPPLKGVVSIDLYIHEGAWGVTARCLALEV